MALKVDFKTVGWDGELHGWPDYVRRVRLPYAATKETDRAKLGGRHSVATAGPQGPGAHRRGGLRTPPATHWCPLPAEGPRGQYPSTSCT